jgi:outer membrane protein
MKANPTSIDWVQFRRGLLGLLLLGSAIGCTRPSYHCQPNLAARVVIPPDMVEPEELPLGNSVQPSGAETPSPTALLKQPEAIEPAPAELPAPLPEIQADSQVCQLLTLPDAIGLSFRLQPRLRASLETIRQAQGREDIAFAAYLPMVSSGYSLGGYDLSVGGTGVALPGSPPFNFIPPGGALPVGLDIQAGYQLVELNVQWLVCDFGRRVGRYNQSGLAVDIAQLQTDRAYQTVANDVSTAYYQVLRAQSLHRIAVESVNRAEEDREEAQKLARGGVIEREKVLRAEVALATAQRGLDIAQEQRAVSVAALNLAIGLNVGETTGVVETSDVPPITMSLADCLQAAVDRRREFQVVRRTIQVAVEGTRVARADFAPRVVADGYLNHFDQGSPDGNADLAVGFIKLDWGLYEGGRRTAELRVNESRVREAQAQAEAIADNIAFQVNQAYHRVVAARKGIDRALPAVEQSRETYRLVSARNREGDATPSELIDAEEALTRAQQDYSNAIYDYLTAIARLDYAMGVTPTPL